jgi:O-antigen/teichoic acid export membrane protein
MKVLVLPVSAVLGIVNVRLIIEHYGLDAYAQYGLLVAIGNLLPFADLGISAAVMNVVGGSDDPRSDQKVQRILVSCFRLLVVSCSVLIGLTVLITVQGWWPALLGSALNPATGPITAAVCLALVATSLLVSPGQRVLAGLGKNHVSIGVLGLQTPLVLVALLLITGNDAPFGPYIAVIPYVAMLGLQIFLISIAGRSIKPSLGRALRDVPRLRTVRGGAVFDVAWPMLILMLGSVVAMQTDRLMLSHFSTRQALAEYNLGAQIFLPVLQVVSAAGFSLWPIFARQRAHRDRASPMPISLVFGGAAAAGCAVLAAASGLLTSLASGGRVHLGWPILVAFGLLMVFQSLKYPLGMYLTDAAGLRFQTYILLATLPPNLALSYALAGRLGAPGPVIGSTVAIALQYFAVLAYTRQRQRRAVEQQPAVASDVSDPVGEVLADPAEGPTFPRRRGPAESR